jgi:surface polysaccharide O-acyltransferase-like enzyme
MAVPSLRHEPSKRAQRIEALDALRAAAMLAGIVLHAIAPYMHAPMRNLLLPLWEPGDTRDLDSVFWVIHAIRLPLFFFVSGFVSLQMLRRRGADAFLKDRARRVLLPLVLTFVVVFPVMYFIWCWGWTVRGWGTWRHAFLFHFGPDVQRNILGLFHLWFLEYLFAYVLVFWALERLRVLHLLLARLWLAVLIPIGTACAAFQPDWFLDFHNSFVPQTRALVYFGLFFVWGAAVAARLEANGRTLRQFTRFWPLFVPAAAWSCYLLLSIILPAVRIGGQGLCQAVLDVGPQSWRFGALLTITAATSTWALVGMATAFIPRLGRVGRYLADASYWVYLMHLVWIGLGVMALHWLAWPGVAKSMAVMAIASAGTLGSFAFVRGTALHRLIGTRLGVNASTALEPASTRARPQTSAAFHSSQP